MISGMFSDRQVDHAKWVIIKKTRTQVHVVLGKGEGPPSEGRKAEMFLSQGISRHLFDKRTQPSSSSVSSALDFLGFHDNAQTQTISKRHNGSF